MTLASWDREPLNRAGIADDVIDARRYESIDRRSNADDTMRRRLKAAGISSKVVKDDARYPGLLIPLWSPRGRVDSYQYRPKNPRKDPKDVKGDKRIKYESAVGRPQVVDVNPLCTDKAYDSTVPLIITEGAKKADAMLSASRAEGSEHCVVSLAGVFNWRSKTSGTLGDWEDINLSARKVYVVFDADAATNRNVAMAMARLGRWLRSRVGSKGKVVYVVTPELPSFPKTGADDWLAHKGNTLKALLGTGTSKPPDVGADDPGITEARLAERVAAEVMVDRFRYCRSLGGWMGWDGVRWRVTDEELVRDAVRVFFFSLVAAADPNLVATYAKLLSKSKIAAVTDLAKGVDGVHAVAEDFNDHPSLLNCPNGVVDLATGEVLDHDPALLMTKVTAACYRPEATHEDWDTALLAFADPDTERWCQRYLGTGLTGYVPETDVATFWHGGGSNGKSTILGSAQRAMGEYARTVLHTLLGSRNTEHSTEKMDLFALRLAVIEELPDGHRLDVAKLKSIVGTDTIAGRKVHKDSVEFHATHSLVVTTNYRPVVNDVDEGTWRRLRMVPFPHTYGLDGEPVDRNLRHRLSVGEAQQEAVLGWLVAGAVEWLKAGRVLGEEPAAVQEATAAWRRSGDLLLAWVDDRYEYEPDAFEPTNWLLLDFNTWLSGQGNASWSERTFSERVGGHRVLASHGVTSARQRVTGSVNPVRGFKGLARPKDRTRL